MCIQQTVHELWRLSKKLFKIFNITIAKILLKLTLYVTVKLALQAGSNDFNQTMPQKII